MSKPSGCLRMMSSLGIAIDPSVDKETIVWVRRQVGSGGGGGGGGGGGEGKGVFFLNMACTTFLDHIISAVHGHLFGVV